MTKNGFLRAVPSRMLAATLLFTCCSVIQAENRDSSFERKDHNQKVVGAYFEEWSIYSAGYNIADIQNSGAADVLTHRERQFCRHMRDCG